MGLGTNTGTGLSLGGLGTSQGRRSLGMVVSKIECNIGRHWEDDIIKWGEPSLNANEYSQFKM